MDHITRSRQNQLAKRIQVRLRDIGKTPRGASVEANLGASTIRNIIEGRSKYPRLDTLKSIAHVLEVDFEWLTSDLVELKKENVANALHMQDDIKFFDQTHAYADVISVYLTQAKPDIILLRRSEMLTSRPKYLDPSCGGYAVLLLGEKLSPIYSTEDMIFVNPRLRIVSDTDCLFYLKADGTVPNLRAAVFGRLQSENNSTFTVLHYQNLNSVELAKEGIELVHAVIGKQHRTR